MADTNISKEYFEELMEKLKMKGEDAGEFAIWRHLYDALTNEEKIELVTNLEKEWEDLKNLGE